MLTVVKSFFKPVSEVEHLRRVVGALIVLLAVTWVSILVFEFKSLQPKTTNLSDSDRLGMIILSDRASRS